MDKPIRLACVVLTAVYTTHAFACLWDYDTLAVERQRFPSALELITGKFLRHSPEYYHWRIKDRTERLQQTTVSPEVFDDLAVAHDKLGEHDQAVAYMLQKEERYPGLYETYANLGTFHIHAGRLQEGLQHIDRAIAINPDAHFGREIYQKLLVQYVQQQQADAGTSLPLAPSVETRNQQFVGFGQFVLTSLNVPLDDSDAELQKAIKGVAGMMRFGHHDSPILLEAMGDLLLSVGDMSDAKRLATRAYLKASFESDDQSARQAYTQLAEAALQMQTTSSFSHKQLSITDLTQQLQQEIQQAERWYHDVKSRELTWIAEGGDVDAQYAAYFYEEPAVNPTTGYLFNDRNRWPILALIVSILLLLASPFAVRRFLTSAIRSDTVPSANQTADTATHDTQSGLQDPTHSGIT
jgi:tetratricopeptide (TPR) repeat protein